MDMVGSYLIENGDDHGNDCLIIESDTVSVPVYRVCYPEEWQYPPRYEAMTTYDVTPKGYVPYKRISHFREHLHRLTYSQFVTIPTSLWAVVCYGLSTRKTSKSDVYFFLKRLLRKHNMSKYNEHIHHMISRYTRRYLNIDPMDFMDMCLIFRQIESVVLRGTSRKNMFSYYLLVQFILYLFHYHPFYCLPSISNDRKRHQYYVDILSAFSKTQMYSRILYIHFDRKRDCRVCCVGESLFDNYLHSLL